MCFENVPRTIHDFVKLLVRCFQIVHYDVHQKLGQRRRILDVLKRSMCMTMLVEKSGSQCNLNAFDRVDHEQAELAIKNVLIPNNIEVCAWLKAVVSQFAVMPVSGLPVVVHHAEATNHDLFVAEHSALCQQCHLLARRKGRFLEFHLPPPEKRNTRRERACLKTEARRVCCLIL